MATTPATVNGTTVQLPLSGDTAGAAGAAAIFTLFGLLFTGVGQVDGSVKFSSLRSASTPLAASGTVQLGSADQLAWRDPTDTYDITLGPDAAGNIVFGIPYSPVVAVASATCTPAASVTSNVWTPATLTPTSDPLSCFSTNGTFTAPSAGVYLLSAQGNITWTSSVVGGNFKIYIGYPAGVLSTFHLAQFSSHQCVNAVSQPWYVFALWKMSAGEQTVLQAINSATTSIGSFSGVFDVKKVAEL
jgi:hypothetical protein